MSHTVDYLLQWGAAAHPNRLAATLQDETATFGVIERRTNRLVRAFQHWGMKRGDRLLMDAGLSLRNLDVYFAAARLGATFVPANPQFSLAEMTAVVEYVQPHWLVVDAERQALGEALAAQSGVPLGVMGGDRGNVAGYDLDASAARASDAVCMSAAQPDDVQVMYLTSGSTGTPKAVMISHRAHWLRFFPGAGPALQNGGRGVVCMFPLFHMAGWMMVMHAWASHRAVHLTPNADGEALLRLVERWSAAELYCIPAVWRRVFECRQHFDASSLRAAATGTSLVEPDLIAALRERFPRALNTISYGSTEMGGALTLAHDEIDAHPRSVGLPMPGVEARIEDGELWLRSRASMDGYFRLPEETAAAFADGWYRTGDLAECDADGYFMITGRRREVIRSGGETISPVEVEAALADLPGVHELAIVGIPHVSWGEIVCAAVVLKDGHAVPTLSILRGRLEHLAGFKHPRMVVAVDAIPRTAATGQVQRARLRDTVVAQTDQR